MDRNERVDEEAVCGDSVQWWWWCAGGVDLAAVGIDGMAAVKRGIHATLSRCLHTLNLFKAIDLFHDGVVPAQETLPACRHRKLRLLFMLDPAAVNLQGHQVPPTPTSAPSLNTSQTAVPKRFPYWPVLLALLMSLHNRSSDRSHPYHSAWILPCSWSPIRIASTSGSSLLLQLWLEGATLRICRTWSTLIRYFSSFVNEAA